MRAEFDDYVLDSPSRQLTRRGEAIHLSRKAFDALAILLERRPDAVTKEELHARLWPGTFVSDANLSVVIAEVRRALDDEPQAPRFVRTVHRIGYAFCGEAGDSGTPLAPGRSRKVWLVWNDRALPLADGENIVGRDPESAVWLDVPGVSRRHARVLVAGDTVTLHDLGSKNGTSVNGALLQGARLLAAGDRIRVGSVELEFRTGGVTTETLRL